jgi:hypothetical protein
MTSLPPHPVVLASETSSVIDNLTCSLCHELVMNPVLTPCDHVFCRPCIVQALQHRHECPNDRKQLYIAQLTPMTGVLLRIWEQVGVQCPNQGCAWRGTAGLYTAHATTCRPRLHLSAEREGQYKSEIARLEARIQQVEESGESRIRQLRETIRGLREELEEAQTANEVLSGVAARLCAEQSRVQFDRSYSYDRESVVQLAQLICKYLENKPPQIDSSRIFNCVRSCHEDLERNYTDNPEYYEVDMCLLLNVCQASRWFTDKQMENIKSWCKGRFE